MAAEDMQVYDHIAKIILSIERRPCLALLQLMPQRSTRELCLLDSINNKETAVPGITAPFEDLTRD
jgi:hypothetical protein